MAAPTLSVLSSPNFLTLFDRMLRRWERMVRKAEIRAAESRLTTCYWSDKYVSACRSLANIHYLESGLQFCPRVTSP